MQFTRQLFLSAAEVPFNVASVHNKDAVWNLYYADLLTNTFQSMLFSILLINQQYYPLSPRSSALASIIFVCSRRRPGL